MNAHHWQPTTLALVLLVGASACDSGYKQIGGLDDAGATETNDDADSNDDDNVPADDDEGETGEVCSDPGVFDCTSQDIDVEYTHAPTENEDLLLTCAANVEPIVDGYRVALTHCSTPEGDPWADRELILSGDWPEPELADGTEPLTEVHLIEHHEAGDGYTAHWAILRDLDHERIKLLAFEGTAMLIDPNDLLPLWLSLDEAACTPGPLPCTPDTQYQEFPVGFTVSYGCAWGSVAHDTMITDFGIDEGTGTAYDVLVGFAVTHECYPDGDFQELQLGIVGKSVAGP